MRTDLEAKDLGSSSNPAAYDAHVALYISSLRAVALPHWELLEWK